MIARDTHSTILVVEDDDALRNLYVEWLDAGTFEFDVESAATGTGALDAIDHAVDVVVLDRRLPDEHGDDVLRRIRDRNYSCAVAMVTGTAFALDDRDDHHHDHDHDHGRDHDGGPDRGFDAHLTKPITREELVETIRRLLPSDTRGTMDAWRRPSPSS